MDDLISRQAAIEALRLIPCDLGKRELEDAIKAVEQLPSAQPVRHGKWKKIRGAINCSACKSSSWSMSFEDLVTSFNYCPNCGAKMDEEEKEKAFWPKYSLKPCVAEQGKQNEA